MNTSLKLAVGLYLLVMAACLGIFFAQQLVVYDDHIRPGREQSQLPVAVMLKDKASGEAREAEITFVNDSIVTNPLRMGNEIEEHLLPLLVANLATGALLVILVFAVLRRVEPDGAANPI